MGQNFAFRISGQNLWFKLKRRMFDKLSAELDLKDDDLPKLGLKLLIDIEKHYPRLLEEFNWNLHFRRFDLPIPPFENIIRKDWKQYENNPNRKIGIYHFCNPVCEKKSNSHERNK
jgi:hypothetical protein